MRAVMGVCLLVCGLLAPAGATAPQQASRLPVAYWKLDEAQGPTAFASIGPLHGAWNGTITPVASPLPPLSYNTPNSRAVQLNGGLPDDFIEIASGPALDNLQESSYSISAWVRPASAPPAGVESKTWNATYGLVTKQGYHEGLIYRRDHYLQFDHYSTGNVWSGAPGIGLKVPPDGTWRHVVGAWDREGGKVRIYVDGLLRGSGGATGPAREFSINPWRIGIAIPSSGGDWSWPYDGMIDDVRMYNFALDEKQAGILAAGVPPPTGVTATPGVQQVTLSWTPPAPSDYPYAYAIRRSVDGGAFEPLETDGAVTGSSYVDTTAVTPNGQGPTYTYQIVAVSVAESGVATSNSALPLLPDPRTKDHEEGLLGDNCACGAAIARPWAAVFALAAALTLLALRRVQ